MNIIKVKQFFNDKYMEEIKGTFIDPDNSWTYINNSNIKDINIHTENDNKIAMIKRNYISKELCDLAVNSYMDAGKMVSTNRGIANGTISREKNNSNFNKTAPINSSVIGYIDSANHKKPCRLTSYSSKYFNKYNEGLPFIERINEGYKEIATTEYNKQFEESLKVQNYIIPNTVFTTVTINYNFRSAVHKDKGDFKDGFGTLVVCSSNISGGLLLFPRYKLAIELFNGDFLSMNVHEWHCNSTINYNNGYRLSFISYLRQNMVKCDMINKRLDILDKNNGSTWHTNDMILFIFKKLGSANIPNKVMHKNDIWWEMVFNNYYLIYKNKRYFLNDKNNNKIIYNLEKILDYVLTI